MRTLAEPTDHSQPNITATLVRYAGPTGVYDVESVRTVHCEWCRGDPESSTSRASTHGGQVVIYLVAVVGSKSTNTQYNRQGTKEMEKKTVVDTCLGPIEVRTKFKLKKRWLAIATFGLVQRGVHIGVAVGDAISRGQLHTLVDQEMERGEEYSDHIRELAANPVIHLGSSTGFVLMASRYHERAVKYAQDLGAEWEARGYTIANSL